MPQFCSKKKDSERITARQALKTAASDEDLAFRQKERDIASYNGRLFGGGNSANEPILVGGFKHFLFSIVYGIILPIDFHIFQDGWLSHHQPELMMEVS